MEATLSARMGSRSRSPFLAFALLSLTGRILLLLAFCIGCGGGAAYSQERVLRLGILTTGSAQSAAHLVDALRVGLRAFGYEDGRNLQLVERYAEGDYGRLPQLAGELAAARVTVIAAGTERSLVAAQSVARQIPVVVIACDPLPKLLRRISDTGYNATGISCVAADLYQKRLGYMKALLPDIERAAMIYHPDDISEAELSATTEARLRFGIDVRRYPVRTVDDLERAFPEMVRARAQAVYVSFGGFTIFNSRRIAALAISHRIPSFSAGSDFVEAGGLLSYGATLQDGWRRSAYLIDRIARGSSATQLPVEEPTRFYLFVNQRTANMLGLSIPDLVIAEADALID